MKLQRFFGKFDFVSGTVTITEPELINQIKNVFRLVPGDGIILCDGKGNEAEVEIKSLSKKEAILDILNIRVNENEPDTKVVLYCSILKKENFELVVQKATEIGVSKIVPLITKRTVKLSLKTNRLETIAKEAAEQSGRGIIPVISEPMVFESALSDAGKNAVNYFLEVSADEPVVSKPTESAGIFIGPEGGWDTEEIEAAKKSGFRIASLGKLTLRAETAAIIASYLAVGNGS